MIKPKPLSCREKSKLVPDELVFQMPNSPLFSIVVAVTIAWLLPSCGKGSKDGSAGSGSPDPGVPQASIVSAQISDLVEHPSGAVTYKGELFSGRAFERDAQGERVKEHYYYQGYLHGPVREFYEDGRIKSETQYEKGVANGISFEWDIDGKMTQILYKDGIETNRATRDPNPASAKN